MKNSFKGFTLVEVLIVIIIVGILIAALLPRLTGVQATARDTARAADTRSIATAAQLYVAENGSFPATGCLTGGHELVTGNYVSSLPTDPQGNGANSCANGAYYATGGSIGSTTVYGVFAEVENESNGNVPDFDTFTESSTGANYVSVVQ